MWLFDLVGGVVCAAASIPVRIAGDVMEGVGILTGIDLVADMGNAVAEFSDGLQSVAEDALDRMTESKTGDEILDDAPDAPDDIEGETQEDDDSDDG